MYARVCLGVYICGCLYTSTSKWYITCRRERRSAQVYWYLYICACVEGTGKADRCLCVCVSACEVCVNVLSVDVSLSWHPVCVWIWQMLCESMSVCGCMSEF